MTEIKILNTGLFVRSKEIDGIREYVMGGEVELNSRQLEKLEKLKSVQLKIEGFKLKREQNRAISLLFNCSLPMAKHLKKDANYVFGAPASTSTDIERRRNIGFIETKIETLEDLQFNLCNQPTILNGQSDYKAIPMDSESHELYLKYERMIQRYLDQKAELDGSKNHGNDEELEQLRKAMEAPKIIESSTDPSVLITQFAEDIEAEEIE